MSNFPPDTAQRPNRPMFIDPVADLGPSRQAGSWYVIANLRAQDREFGIFIHYIKAPADDSLTLAITDVTSGRYYLDEDGKGEISTTQDGFEVNANNLHWSASATDMRIQGHLKSGELFDLTLCRVGPAMAYNGTGYFPLVDNSLPTWEFAFPTMETTGTVTIGKEAFQVTGNSWFDRQWFETGVVSASGVWIVTRLPNGDALAVWDVIGNRERAWANIMRPDGTLTIADVEPLSRNMSGLWTSSQSNVTWASVWNIIIPGTQTRLVATSTSQGQEILKGLPRVEAVVHITGTHEGRQISSVGYAEMPNNPRLHLRMRSRAT